MFKRDYKQYWSVLEVTDVEEKKNIKTVFLLKGKFLKKAEKIKNRVLFAVKVTQAKYEIIRDILTEENIDCVESIGCPFCNIYRECYDCIWNKVYGHICLDEYTTRFFSVFTNNEKSFKRIEDYLKRLKQFEKFAKENKQ